MTPTLFLAGAFDRFNYGDLLFPIVTRQALATLGFDAEYVHLSLRDADLCLRGGVRTRSLAELARRPPPRGSVLLVAGGEVLSARWLDAAVGLTTPARSLALKLLARAVGVGVADRLSRRAMGARRPLPWVLAAADLGAPVRVAYNAVGGTGLDRLPRRLREAARSRLTEALHLSVRDRRSKDILDTWRLGREVDLAPDSAALVAELFARDELDRHLDPRATECLRRGTGFAVFQVGRYPAWGQVPRLAAELRALHRDSGLAIVLLPLGQAPGHEDLRPLQGIRRRLGEVPTILLEAPGVLEIMAHIAAARLFIGSSLHGNLTALAFAVPRVGFGTRVAKLDSFLGTWDLTQSTGSATVAELCTRGMTALQTDHAQLESSRQHVVEATWDGFRRLRAAIAV